MDPNSKHIESLLDTITADVRSVAARVRPGQLVYVTYTHTVECVGCGRMYTGTARTPEGYPPPDRTGWCPLCVHEHANRWWENCFRMTLVREVHSDQNTT